MFDFNINVQQLEGVLRLFVIGFVGLMVVAVLIYAFWKIARGRSKARKKANELRDELNRARAELEKKRQQENQQ